MNFGEAIAAMKNGERVCRTGWNGSSMYLVLVTDWDFKHPETPDGRKAQELEHQPFIVMKTAQDMYVPWLASQSDVLAEDWEIT